MKRIYVVEVDGYPVGLVRIINLEQSYVEQLAIPAFRKMLEEAGLKVEILGWQEANSYIRIYGEIKIVAKLEM